MSTKKIWQLTATGFDQSDQILITGLGCSLEIVPNDPLELEYHGKTYRIQLQDPEILITTTCEKQESMLYLKYGDNLRLKTIIHKKLELSYADIDLVSYSRPTTF